MVLSALLKVLADGKYHSGENLGAQLSVSRAAVWKQVQKLKQFGVSVHSIPGKGYRLANQLELLDAEKLLNFLDADNRSKVECLQIDLSVSSTNDLALQAANEGRNNGYIYFAEQQTAGRGRRGRAWVSPFACNLYFSIVRKFDGGVAVLEGLSLAVAVAVARALKQSGLPNPTVKWPNDILYEQKKLAGILLELTGDVAGECCVVIGVGVNLKMPPIAGQKIDQPWIDWVSITRKSYSRQQIAGVLVNEILTVLADFSLRGFKAYKDEWLSMDAYRNQVVELHGIQEPVRGVASGVDDSGAVCIKTLDGMQTFTGGELSLKETGSRS